MTIAVKDALTGAAVQVETPLGPGTAAAAASKPVTLSTEDKALLAALTPASRALTRTLLLTGVTVTGAGSAVADGGCAPSFEADLSGTGSVTATILIQGRNVASGLWVLLGTITLSGTTTASDGFASPARYMEYRANCTAITGTAATLTVVMGS